jgi:hypothetical protein
MRRWKSALAIALVALPLGAGAAQAQGWDRPYFNTRGWVEQFDRRLNRISARLDEAIAHREISPREARRLTAQRDYLVRTERQAMRDRYITATERDRLDSQLRALAQRLRIQVNDRGW